MQTDPLEFKRLAISEMVVETLPYATQKSRIVGQDDDLFTLLSVVADLPGSVILAKTVLAIEGVVEYNNFRGAVRVVLELRQKKGERERAAVA